MRGEGRGCGASPKNENLDTLRCIFPAFQGITIIYNMSGVDLAGETNFIVQRDTGRCAKSGQSIFSKIKLRQQISSSTAINIAIVNIAEMI